MKLKHIITTFQFMDNKILDQIFDKAEQFEKQDLNNQLDSILQGKIMATLFYEPSTRTRFSFEAAMHKLGGGVISTESASYFSSVSKGESLQDTIRTIAGYADVIVLRHPKVGSVKVASSVSDISVINGGDGIGEHPTQSLLDMYTIRKEFKKKKINSLQGLKVGLVGDLYNGRTIHSLIKLLGLLKNIEIYLISPWQISIPGIYTEYMENNGIKYYEFEKIEHCAQDLDVLYVTRIQKERFESEDEYNRMKSFYKVDKNIINQMKKQSIVMHPLPRVTEISPDIDMDDRCTYFRQAKNGMYVRMALLEKIFQTV